MNRLAILPILSVLSSGIFLTGCKEASSVPEPAANIPAAAARPASGDAATPTASQDLRPVVVCFGDSLTAGYGIDAGESYPDQLQKLLDAQGFDYRVVNSGVSGNTTKDGVERLPRLLAHPPQLVVVEFGGNDGLRGLPLEQTEANLAQMIDSIQAAGATVALAGITLPPDYGQVYIARFNAMYTQLARRYHVRLLPFLLQGVYGVPGGMQADATHATAKGNVQVARNVDALIRPLIGPLTRPRVSPRVRPRVRPLRKP